MADGRGVKNLPANLPAKSVGKIRFLPVSVWSELNFAKSLKISILLKINSLLRGMRTWLKASCAFLNS